MSTGEEAAQPDRSLTHDPDTSLTVFGIWLGFSVRFGAGRPPRTKARKFSRTAIDEAQGDVGEADEPVAVRTLAEADGFANDRFRQEKQGASPLDLAARPHAPDQLARAIVEIAGRLDERPGRRAIELRRLALAESLVRSVMVELPAKGVEAVLLMGNGGPPAAGRPRT